ncbi:MAG: LysR family transcriptional regulator [Rhodospirillales bacterium]|nr:LysR family transcriptional regulator [Rhodospirillales bacterium]
MNVALARTFVAVVETGGFASAGVQENVAQSTVSMRIKGLEDRLGKT